MSPDVWLACNFDG